MAEPRRRNGAAKELGRASRGEKFRKNRIFGKKITIKVQFSIDQLKTVEVPAFYLKSFTNLNGLNKKFAFN